MSCLVHSIEITIIIQASNVKAPCPRVGSVSGTRFRAQSECAGALQDALQQTSEDKDKQTNTSKQDPSNACTITANGDDRKRLERSWEQAEVQTQGRRARAREGEEIEACGLLSIDFLHQLHESARNNGDITEKFMRCEQTSRRCCRGEKCKSACELRCAWGPTFCVPEQRFSIRNNVNMLIDPAAEAQGLRQYDEDTSSKAGAGPFSGGGVTQPSYAADSKSRPAPHGGDACERFYVVWELLWAPHVQRSSRCARAAHLRGARFSASFSAISAPHGPKPPDSSPHHDKRGGEWKAPGSCTP